MSTSERAVTLKMTLYRDMFKLRNVCENVVNVSTCTGCFYVVQLRQLSDLRPGGTHANILRDTDIDY